MMEVQRLVYTSAELRNINEKMYYRSNQNTGFMMKFRKKFRKGDGEEPVGLGKELINVISSPTFLQLLWEMSDPFLIKWMNFQPM